MKPFSPRKSRRATSPQIKVSRRDPTRCPLCDMPNHCGLAIGARDCWCFAQVVPWQPAPRLPREIRSARCLCRPCLMSQKALDRALQQMELVLKQHR
jgi:hypothetical protein